MNTDFLKETLKRLDFKENFLHIVPINHPIRRTNLTLSTFQLDKLWLKAIHPGEFRDMSIGVYWYEEDDSFYYVSNNKVEKVMPIKAFEFDSVTNEAYDDDGK